MREIVWRGLRLSVPPDWELARHAISAEAGRLMLVDRRRQRMTVAWVRVPAAPDVQQALKDHRNRDMEEDGNARFEALTGLLGWQGHRRHGSKETISRAVRYDRSHRRWLEVVLTWPDGSGGLDRELERHVLAGLEVLNAEDAHGFWRAFGLEIRMPSGWELVETAIKSADATFEFTRNDQRVAIRRMGMADTWYHDRPRRWLAQQLATDQIEFTQDRVGGRTVTRAWSEVPGSPVRRWLKRQRIREDVIWLDEACNAVMCVTTYSRGDARLDPAHFDVTCYATGGGG